MEELEIAKPKELKTLTDKMRKFYIREQNEINSKWNEYHKKNEEIEEAKEKIKKAIIGFGNAVDLLNSDFKKMEEKSKINPPKDIRIKFFDEFNEDIYTYKLN